MSSPPPKRKHDGMSGFVCPVSSPYTRSVLCPFTEGLELYPQLRESAPPNGPPSWCSKQVMSRFFHDHVKEQIDMDKEHDSNKAPPLFHKFQARCQSRAAELLLLHSPGMSLTPQPGVQPTSCSSNLSARNNTQPP